MAYPATVLHVLIASPSDVPDERTAFSEALYEWNALNSQTTGYVLLPVMWESHSAPAMGDRPQEIINNQVVRTCDMLIGAFWTRLGSPTGVEESGTVEEIRWFLKQSKPVMLYYSKRSIDPDTLDTVQFEKLKTFKQSIRDKGIQDQYGSIGELKQKLSRHLTIVLRNMSVNPMVDARVTRAAKESTKEADAGGQTAGKEIWLEDYSDKAFAVRGDTTAFADDLKKEGGKWIPLKTGGKGWMFSKRHLKDVAKIVGIPAVMRKA